jgi:hypothetical protein
LFTASLANGWGNGKQFSMESRLGRSEGNYADLGKLDAGQKISLSTMTKTGFTHEKNLADHWITPRSLLSALGEFDLDPCACELGQPWPTANRMYILPAENGLILPWFGRVWLNPPYGSETPKWIERMALHADGIMLIFARTETIAFQRLWQHGDAIFFPKGRIQFFRYDGTLPKTGSTAPSCLVAFGERNVSALGDCGLCGALVSRWQNLKTGGLGQLSIKVPIEDAG